MSATRMMHICDPIDSVLLEVGVFALNRGTRETPFGDFLVDCLEGGIAPTIVPVGSEASCLGLELVELGHERDVLY